MSLTEKFVLLGFALIAAAAFFALWPANAQETGKAKRFISLTATGQVAATPDKVEISTGVTSQAETAKEALAKNTDSMSGVVAALKAEGIDPKDIQTSEFSVQPVYEQRQDNRTPAITGYQVTNSVRITVRDTKKLGAILDKVVGLGANQVNSIEFGVTNPGPLKDDARRKAMAEAKETAKLYADAAGANLGNVLTVTEESGIVIPRAGGRMMEMKAAAPIEAGTAMIEVRVNVTFELK